MKKLLMDFYLELLSRQYDNDYQHAWLADHVRNALAFELNEQPETVQRIFERMANEDGR
jgi:hypothetical protein